MANAFPVPASTKRPDVPADFALLRDRLDLVGATVGHIPGTSSANLATITDPYRGMVVMTDGNGYEYLYTGSTWRLWNRPAFTFTPTLLGSVTNPTLGTGSTAVGEAQIIQGRLFGKIAITFGTSPSNGAGIYSLGVATGYAAAAADRPAGTFLIKDEGTSWYQGALYLVTSSAMRLMRDTVGEVTAAGPVAAFAAGDHIYADFSYLLAA